MESRTGVSKIITILVLFLAAAGVLWAVVSFQNEEVVVLEKGQPAPTFELEDLDGNTVSLSDYKGKVVMVNFWATWCEPCRDEMPALEQAYQAYKDQGLVVLGANLKENIVSVKGFANEFGLTFPILLDKESTVALDLYKVKPIPTTFFIDRNGVLREKAEMPMSFEYIENMLKPLL